MEVCFSGHNIDISLKWPLILVKFDLKEKD